MVSKKPTSLHDWLKDVAPSAELRRWFSHDPKKWTEFQKRYFAELDSHPEACATIRSAAPHGRVTLVYSSHDTEHNNAVALKEYLSARKGKKGGNHALNLNRLALHARLNRQKALLHI